MLRGYEWWLMSEAKKRNPSVLTYGDCSFACKVVYTTVCVGFYLTLGRFPFKSALTVSRLSPHPQHYLGVYRDGWVMARTFRKTISTTRWSFSSAPVMSITSTSVSLIISYACMSACMHIYLHTFGAQRHVMHFQWAYPFALCLYFCVFLCL